MLVGREWRWLTADGGFFVLLELVIDESEDEG